MSPRTLLCFEQRTRLFSFPIDPAEMTRHDALDADDLALVRARRRAGNRPGFAIQLWAFRHLSRVLDLSESLPEPKLIFVVQTIGKNVSWNLSNAVLRRADMAQKDRDPIGQVAAAHR
jgi:hypothetical protein